MLFTYRDIHKEVDEFSWEFKEVKKFAQRDYDIKKMLEEEPNSNSLDEIDEYLI